MRLRNIRGSKDVIASCPFVVQEPESCRGRWAEVFGNENPIHIEVGMGKGRFLMDMAVLHAEINYIGIEMYDSVLLRAVQKREKLETELKNLFFCNLHWHNSAFPLIKHVPLHSPSTSQPSFKSTMPEKQVKIKYYSFYYI